MKREKYEQLGALQKMIYDYLEKALYENQYTLELDKFKFDHNDYVSCALMFGGYKVRVSINKKGYVCWHCDLSLESLLREIPHIEKKLVAQASRMIKENEAAYRVQRIKELEQELEELKSA